MRNLKLVFSYLAPITCIILINGCTPTMNLKYTKPTVADMSLGEICVIVKDRRSQGYGGDNPMRVGTTRSGAGIPYALNASPNREPQKVIKELVTDCLKASGYNVIDQSDGVPQLNVMIKSFWTDGYVHNRMDLNAPMELKKNDDSVPTWVYILESNEGVTLWGLSDLQKGFSKMLNKAKEKLIEQFKDPEFHGSYKAF